MIEIQSRSEQWNRQRRDRGLEDLPCRPQLVLAVRPEASPFTDLGRVSSSVKQGQGSRAVSAHVLGHHRRRGGPCVHTKEQFTERL